MSTVLCLDDFTCSLTEATHVLRAIGYEVLAADENKHALELAAEKPLDAVILNCHRDATSTTIVRRCRCVMRSDRLRSYKLPTRDLREIFFSARALQRRYFGSLRHVAKKTTPELHHTQPCGVGRRQSAPHLHAQRRALDRARHLGSQTMGSSAGGPLSLEVLEKRAQNLLRLSCPRKWPDRHFR
jgi:CheY-like chemotaxis protein